MIEILINDCPAVIRKDSRFDYIMENNFFDSSDGYTLSIEFPLEDCPENMRIFGFINRDDIGKPSSLFRCSITSGLFRREGAISVMDIDNLSVKCQFIEGVDPEEEELIIDSVYVNDLDLGQYPGFTPDSITPEQARAGTVSEVCYPWYNAGADVVNNYAYRTSDLVWHWHPDTTRLSWQPYLIVILRRIIDAIGYTADFSQFQNTEWKDVIICNTIPASWSEKNYKDILPRWTVRQFFSKLGLIMKGSFSWDNSLKKVYFSFYSASEDNLPVKVLEDVIDEYSASVEREEEDADFLPLRRFRYKQPDFVVWKYLFCPWAFNAGWKQGSYLTYADYLADSSSRKPVLAYIHELECWLVPRRLTIYSEFRTESVLMNLYKYASWTQGQPLDIFSPPGFDKERDYEELDFSPVTVDAAFEGIMFWLSGISDNSDDDSDATTGEMTFDDGFKSGGITYSKNIPSGKTRQTNFIESYSEDKESEFFTEVFLGKVSPDPVNYPFPIVDATVNKKGVVGKTKIFRLSDQMSVSIDPKVKYTFKFISSQIPDVSSLFIINGIRYICRKITASFSGDGMSEILKGEFYRCL
ncbi:MAG: hypothetical protein K2G90_00505 [Muribaculaceae bacterium]|nr:hypothetical protein [Muribaculaceae bacterium]